MKKMFYTNDLIRLLEPWTGFAGFQPNLPWTKLDMNVHESPFDYRIDMNLPEMRKKDLKVNIDNQTLTIEGYRNKKNGLPLKKGNDFQVSFRKKFVLPEGVDTAKIHAKFKNGVLSIALPKKEEYINYREIPVEGVNESKEHDFESMNNWLQKTGTSFKRMFKKAA
jgi:HSP20 family protein